MQSLKIEPSVLVGTVRIPPSKSISHRAIIAAGLADGVSTIDNIILSEDIKATLNGLRALGAVINCISNNDEEGTCKLDIQGRAKLECHEDTINCCESGSTLRFLLPLATLTGAEVTFHGAGKLGERPLDIYYRIFEEQGISYQTTNGLLPLTVKGSLRSGTYRVKGDVSSQFITGLLFTLPLLEGDSRIIITTPLESQGYVDLTVDVLHKFGIEIKNNEYKEFLIPGNQKYRSTDYRVEGDYSQAAFWIVAGVLGQKINCLDLNRHSLQGDKVILDIVEQMGAQLRIENNRLEVQAEPTKGVIIDAGQCPDLVPILAVLGALSEGTTRIVNAGRLRIKESDRLRAISTELNKLGGKVQELDEGLIIQGVKNLQGGTVDSWNDHRIAMALAVASIKCQEPVTITGSESVRKSYPHFWDDFKKLGGKFL